MEPTEPNQAEVFRLLVDLADVAAEAGLTMAPDWYVPSTLLVTGYLRSDDDSAVRELDGWRRLLGATAAVSSMTYSSPNSGQVLRELTLDAVVGGVSLRLRATTPAAARNEITTDRIEVAA